MHPGGYITYWRKRWKKGYHKDHLLWVMMDWFIDHAAWEDGEVYMKNVGLIKLKRGEVPFGSISLANFLGASRKAIRNRINVLKGASFLTIKKASKYSIATILNYDKYQDPVFRRGQEKGQQKGQQGASKGASKRATNNTISKEVIIHLNNISGRNFRPESNIDYVIPRLKEGHTKEDCIKVIEKKWRDPDFNRKYFRPETLFRKSKFEGYLNEDIGTKDPSQQTTDSGFYKSSTQVLKEKGML